MTIRTRALFLMGLIAAVSCSDAGNPLIPEEPQPQPPAALMALDCTVAVSGGGMQCALPQPSSGDARASGELIVGGQNVFVRLAAAAFSTFADTIQFDVTVENLIPQPLGTTDGVSVDPNGVRVFFYQGPVSNNPSAAASVGNADGEAFFTAANQPYFQWNEMLAPNQTSAPRTWKIQYTPGSTSVSFRVYVSAQVQYENGWVDVTPPADTLPQGGNVTLAATARDKVGRTGTVSQSFTWSRGGDGVTTVNASTGEVTALSASGVDTIYVTNGTQTGRAIIVVENAPVFQQDTIAARSNVTVGRPAPRLANRISDTEMNADVVAGTYASVAGGVARVYADGSYDYLSPAGFSGPDSFEFDISDGVHTIKGSVIVNVAASNYWYVQAGGTGDGRDRFPFGSFAAAQDSAVAGDSIFVLSAGATALDGAAVLEDAQALIGQGIPASITLSLNDTTITVLAAGSAPGLSRSDAGPAVTLGVGNTVRGVGITASGGAGITGNAFGTLTTSQLSVSATGPALHLTTGTLAAGFDVLSSTNSVTEGLFLSAVGGTLTATGGAISGAAGTAFHVAGGSVSVTYGGNVTQGNSAVLLSVSGSHTGTLTFPGTLSATAGTGLQFNDADGSYDFTGTTTLNGGDAGVDIGNGSAGTFAFGTGTTITSPTGTAFAVNGSSPTVTYSGDVTQANNALLVDVSEQPGGTVTFQTGTLSATSGTGIQLSNADGTVNFNGTTTLNGGDAGVDILADANGTIGFASGTSITNGTGHGVEVFESAPTLTFAGSISTSTARPVVVDAASPCGSISFTGAISSTGEGILVQDCSAGTVSFNGTSKTLNTGVNQGVTLTNNTGATVSFGGGGLAITTTTGTGFGASGGGDVQVTGANNTIATGSGTGLSLDGVGTGASGVTFRSVSTGAAANGIALNNLTGVGVTVTGDGSTGGSGGSITGTTGHGVSLTGLGSLSTGVTLNFMNVSSGSGGNAAIFGTTFGPLAFTGTALTGTGGPALNLTTGAVSGTFSSVSSSASASTGVSLTGVTGTLNASAGTITGGAAGTAFSVSGGSVGGTIASGISQGNAAQAALTVAGGHSTGTLTFTGNVSASNGTGLQFTDADGVYTLTGNLSLAGGDAGIDIGAGSTGTVNVTPSGGNTAAITSPTGIAITIAGGSADLNYTGNVTQASNAALLSVAGGHSGDVSFPSGTLSASNGTGLLFDNADGTYAFGATVTLNGGDAGIDVTNGSSGIFTFPATASITSPSTGNLVSILNSAPTFTYPGALTKANNNVTGILIASNTGGTINFSGSGVTKSISSGTAAAVNLTSNTNATVNFSGGSLNITSTSGAGFNATGGGTLNVTGANNTIASGTGTALNVQNTAIGASGLTFRSISHSGGANGIVLVNTGTTNGLQVTGDGATNGSGGTILNTAGGDGATAGNGIYLSGAHNVSLNWMALSGHANNGLQGTGVRGLTMNKMRFTGNNGTSNSGTFDESAVNLVDIGGAVKITNSRLDGGAYNAIRFENISGTAPVLDSLVLENDTIESMQGSLVDSRSTAVLVHLQDGSGDVRMRNNRVTFWWGNAIHVLMQGTSSGTARITSNFADNTNGALAGAGGIWVAGCNMGFNISGNSVRNTNGTAIAADKANCAGTTFQGTIDGNAIGVSGVANSGSGTGIGIFAAGRNGTTTVKISNNVLRQINGSANGAITTLIGDAAAMGPAGTLNATISGNNIQESGTTVNNAQHGILVTHGVTSTAPGDTHLGCYDVLNNTIINFVSGVANNRIRVNQRFSTTSRWPGYTGAATGATSGPDMAAYLLARNTASTSTNANSSTGGFLNTVPAGSACPQPSI